MDNKYILIIDDNLDVLKIYGQMVSNLVKSKNINVKTFDSVDKCEQWLEEKDRNIICVLCDVIMPEKDGIYFYNHFREKNKQNMFIFVSGYTIANINNILEDTNNVCFLRKPYSLDEIKTILNFTLENKNVETNN